MLFALIVPLIGGVGACGDIDGGQPFAGTTLYESPTKSFHLRLLEPPWLPVTLQGETIFVVPSSSALSISVTAQESDALYSLHVTPQAGDALTAFQTSASSQNPPWNLSTRQSVTSVGGQSGVDISWQESATVFHREAHIDGASAATSFELRFTSRKSMADDPMIRQMIVGFGPGPAGIAN